MIALRAPVPGMGQRRARRRQKHEEAEDDDEEMKTMKISKRLARAVHIHPRTSFPAFTVPASTPYPRIPPAEIRPHPHPHPLLYFWPQ
ncbi:hypothetical protein K438DRAFT_662842 [Mycena galopus ATCC 62051]|nr:hypothetical protein K438DRAFT_662842 [Mycena galopus ATCC 62051]